MRKCFGLTNEISMPAVRPARVEAFLGPLYAWRPWLYTAPRRHSVHSPTLPADLDQNEQRGELTTMRLPGIKDCILDVTDDASVRSDTSLWAQHGEARNGTGGREEKCQQKESRIIPSKIALVSWSVPCQRLCN